MGLGMAVLPFLTAHWRHLPCPDSYISRPAGLELRWLEPKNASLENFHEQGRLDMPLGGFYNGPYKAIEGLKGPYKAIMGLIRSLRAL